MVGVPVSLFDALSQERTTSVKRGHRWGPVRTILSTDRGKCVFNGPRLDAPGLPSGKKLKALAYVVATGRAFSIEIGNGPDMALLLKQWRQLCLEKKIHFTRVLAKEAIRAKIADADVFLLPSRYEGMSNAALEAMEAGLPILLTRCGGIDTYIDENIGWICEPDDVDGLTLVLLLMLDTPADKLLAGKAGKIAGGASFPN